MEIQENNQFIVLTTHCIYVIWQQVIYAWEFICQSLQQLIFIIAESTCSMNKSGGIVRCVRFVVGEEMSRKFKLFKITSISFIYFRIFKYIKLSIDYIFTNLNNMGSFYIRYKTLAFPDV